MIGVNNSNNQNKTCFFKKKKNKAHVLIKDLHYIGRYIDYRYI